jgi:DNA-binding GntR family transcriptional regulator
MSDWTTGAAVPMLTREEYVAKVLREAILRSEIKPGERLDQTKIAEQFRVSRTPVRNALLILSNEGLVEMTPHAGAMVSEMQPEEIEELYFIRGVLEGIAARLAVESITDEDLALLEKLLEDLDTTDNLDRWIGYNKQFHFQLYSAARRPRLLSLIASIHDLTLPYSRRYIGSEDHRRIASAGHHRIFEACQQRNGPLVEAAVKEHHEAVCKGVLGSCEQTELEFHKVYSIDPKD